MVNVKVEDLLNEIGKTEREIERASGLRKKDLQRHLSRLYKQLDEFRFYMRKGAVYG